MLLRKSVKVILSLILLLLFSFSALAETGLVKMVRGDWNDWLLDEMEAFTGKRSTAYLKDDGVDCVSACQQKLATNKELPNFNGALLRL